MQHAAEKFRRSQCRSRSNHVPRTIRTKVIYSEKRISKPVHRLEISLAVEKMPKTRLFEQALVPQLKGT